MIAIEIVFLVIVALFGVIGLMRGWRKEIIATAGITLAIFADAKFGKAIMGFLGEKATNLHRFILKSSFFIIIAFFSYQGPSLARIVKIGRSWERKNIEIAEAFLSTVVGLINGYLIAGGIWYYLYKQDYPLPPNIFRTPLSETAEHIIRYLPQSWMEPFLPLLIVMLFLFVIIAII
jgi:uncharacterized membrane protein required for colicin V production